MSSPWGWWFRIVLPIGVLLAVFALLECAPVDLWLQDRFYDFERGRWLVDRDEPVGRALFYNGPKYLIYLTVAALLVLTMGPERWRRATGITRRGIGAALIVFIVVPVVAGLGKRTFNVFCPYEIRRYGGFAPYVKVIESYPEGDVPARRGGCFPAGHASGGFACMGLLWLRSSRRWRRGMVAIGIGAGLWMGVYQMLKGAHYFSHTVFTMLLAWFVVVLAGWIAGADRQGDVSG